MKRLVFLLLFLAGCAKDVDKEFGREMARIVPVDPPTFLNGDLAMLFGNANFVARAEVQRGIPGTRRPSVGDLFGRGGSLFFMADEQRGKKGIAGGLSVLWDGPSQTAYLLNDPLQAYAPLRRSATNGALEVMQGAEEVIAGERTRKTTMLRREGTESIPTFVVWRSMEKGDLPIRIQSTNSLETVTITLSRIRMETPAAEAVTLPEGFKKFETADEMIAELVRRRNDAMRARSRGRAPVVLEDEEQWQRQQITPPMRPY